MATAKSQRKALLPVQSRKPLHTVYSKEPKNSVALHCVRDNSRTAIECPAHTSVTPRKPLLPTRTLRPHLPSLPDGNTTLSLTPPGDLRPLPPPLFLTASHPSSIVASPAGERQGNRHHHRQQPPCTSLLEIRLGGLRIIGAPRAGKDGTHDQRKLRQTQAQRTARRPERVNQRRKDRGREPPFHHPLPRRSASLKAPPTDYITRLIHSPCLSSRGALSLSAHRRRKGKPDGCRTGHHSSPVECLGNQCTLCQSCRHELGYDEIGTRCDLCIAEEIAGRYASRKDKSVVVDMVGLDVMNTSDMAVYWYWLNLEDTIVTNPGEPTNLEKNVTTGLAIRRARRYEEDRRKLFDLYDWFGIRRDTPVAQVTGRQSHIRRAA